MWYYWMEDGKVCCTDDIDQADIALKKVKKVWASRECIEIGVFL